MPFLQEVPSVELPKLNEHKGSKSDLCNSQPPNLITVALLTELTGQMGASQGWLWW